MTADVSVLSQFPIRLCLPVPPRGAASQATQPCWTKEDLEGDSSSTPRAAREAGQDALAASG